jgi:hypothetical protein
LHNKEAITDRNPTNHWLVSTRPALAGFNAPRDTQNCHDSEWALIFIPLVTGVANLVVQRKQGLTKSLLTAIVASVAICVLFFVMLIFPGMPFHLSIGGTL